MSANSQTKPSSQHSVESGNGEDDRKPWWWRLLEGLALGAAIVYAVLTYLMWSDSHKNFIIQERAWIKINSGAIDPKYIREGADVQTQVVLVNIGKTTAKRVVSDFSVVIEPSAAPVNFDYSGNHSKEDVPVLEPNDFQAFPVQSSSELTPPKMTKDQAQDLLSGRSYFAVYGQGQYVDVFGKQH